MAAIAGSLVVARNQEYLDMDAPVVLRSGDEIAIIPPLSGG